MIYVPSFIKICSGIQKLIGKDRQPTPLQIKIDEKQVENVEEFNYLGSMITNDARRTREIKARIAKAKTAFNKKKTLLTSKLDLELKKKVVKCYIWSMFCMVQKLGLFGN
jgi:hypothetical protein